MIEVQGDKVILHKFPMSISSNQLYASVKGRLIKSSAGRIYVAESYLWANKNRSAVNKLKEILRGKTLRVDCAFYFPREKLLTKKNTIKRLDFTNRIKILHDALSDIIEVDDSHFISGYFEKRISENYESYIDIKISVAEFL